MSNANSNTEEHPSETIERFYGTEEDEPVLIQIMNFGGVLMGLSNKGIVYRYCPVHSMWETHSMVTSY